MNKPNVTKFIKSIQNGVSKRSPEILTAIGICGMVSSTVMAVKATPKAMMLIEEKKETLEIDDGKLPFVETVKTVWKPYLPALITSAASAACLIGSNSIHVKRNAALVTAYKLSETALLEFKEAAIDTVGEENVKKIREKVKEERIKKDPVENREVFTTGLGEELFYDYSSGRYFYSTLGAIEAAANKINRNITIGDMHASLNEFYSEIGLSPTGLGDIVGWNIDNMIELDRDSATIAEDGRACHVLSFLRPPVHEFDVLY